MSIVLNLPEEVESRLRRQFGEPLERRALEDLASRWYSEGRITSGEAADMLGAGWADAQLILKERGAVLPMTVEEVEADLAARVST